MAVRFISRATGFNDSYPFDVGPPLITPANVQHRSAQFSSSGTARSLDFSSPVSNGSLLVCAVGIDSWTVTVSVIDSLGQTWLPAVGYVNTTDTNFPSRLIIFYYASTASGACTVEVTPSSSALLTLAIAEYSGVAVASPVEGTSSAANTSNNFHPATGSVAVSDFGELVVGAYVQHDTNLTPTVNSPFTLREIKIIGIDRVSLALADDVNASANEGATFNVGISIRWAAQAVSFTPGLIPATPTTSVMPEVRMGPAIPGAPWLPARIPVFDLGKRQQPPPPPPPPTVTREIVPEIRRGPPIPGAPWLPDRVPVFDLKLVIGTPLIPPTPTTSVMPEVRRGPAIPGAPWLANRIPIFDVGKRQQPQPPVIAPYPVYAREVKTGPPIPGAPWLATVLEFPPSRGIQPSQARPPHLLPFIHRVPLDDRRLGRFTEQVSSILSSLVSLGYVKQTAANPISYKIVGGGLTGAGPPTRNTDASVGAVAGCCYVDTLNDDVYVCATATVGLAVWCGPIPATIF